MKLIDKDKVAVEIDERLHKYEQEYAECARDEFWGTARKIRPKIEELKDFRSFIDNIEVKEVDYDKALERAKGEYQTHKSFNGFREMLVRIFPELHENENEMELEKKLTGFQNRYAYENSGELPSAIEIAKHFFKLGLTQKKEYL